MSDTRPPERMCSRCLQMRPAPLYELDDGIEVCEGCMTMYDDDPPEWWECTMEYMRATYDVKAPSVRLN